MRCALLDAAERSLFALVAAASSATTRVLPMDLSFE
jgi:hypothetical protein